MIAPDKIRMNQIGILKALPRGGEMNKNLKKYIFVSVLIITVLFLVTSCGAKEESPLIGSSQVDDSPPIDTIPAEAEDPVPEMNDEEKAFVSGTLSHETLAGTWMSEPFEKADGGYITTALVFNSDRMFRLQIESSVPLSELTQKEEHVVSCDESSFFELIYDGSDMLALTPITETTPSGKSDMAYSAYIQDEILIFPKGDVLNPGNPYKLCESYTQTFSNKDTVASVVGGWLRWWDYARDPVRKSEILYVHGYVSFYRNNGDVYQRLCQADTYDQLRWFETPVKNGTWSYDSVSMISTRYDDGGNVVETTYELVLYEDLLALGFYQEYGGREAGIERINKWNICSRLAGY